MNISAAQAKLFYIISFLLVLNSNAQSLEDYDLWMGYSKIEDPVILSEYQKHTKSIFFNNRNPVLETAQKELLRGIDGLLGQPPNIHDSLSLINTMWVSKKMNLGKDMVNTLKADFERIGNEGFIIKSITVNGKSVLLITANEDLGILYGVFKLLQLMKMHKSLEGINIVDAPKIQLRMLNHWDNLDRTVERGYAGFSLWNWQKLPEYKDPRYEDYARANASIGINATALTNVNANAMVLTSAYLEKVAALAEVFRPYGIK
ncbi:MAG: alpha-glucuronidase, partial [Eudoraea sp.]|nr:alpha-glucuronidase [Eudoraea sp.]